jgi:hypothetical protein
MVVIKVMMIAIIIITTLRARKEVPWMVWMTALELSPFLTSVIISSPVCHMSNRLKHLLLEMIIM